MIAVFAVALAQRAIGFASPAFATAIALEPLA
jgi:hypothetical protein